MRLGREGIMTAPDSSSFNTADETTDQNIRLAVRLREVEEHRLATRIEDCGRRLLRRAQGEPILPQWCRLKLCPICGVRIAKGVAARYRPVVHRVLEMGGEGRFLTLTAPPVLDPFRDAADRHRFARGFTTDAWWRKSAKELGVFTALEFGQDGGHPHVHYLVLAANPTAAGAAVEGLTSRWLRRYPEAIIQAQDASGPLCSLKDLENILGYITKGSRIQAEWPDEAILAAIAHMTNRKRPFTASGLARVGKQAPAVDVV